VLERKAQAIDPRNGPMPAAEEQDRREQADRQHRAVFRHEERTLQREARVIPCGNATQLVLFSQVERRAD